MKKIVYIGLKPYKGDNVAGTGLTWTRGEIHLIEDEVKANKLLEHSETWADAEKEYAMVTEPKGLEPVNIEGEVQIAPEGGHDATVNWEPIKIVVPSEVFKKLQDKELEAVFMSKEDIESYIKWRDNPKYHRKAA